MWMVNIDYILLVLVIISMITRTLLILRNIMNEYRIWKIVNRVLLYLILLDIILNFLNP